MRRGRNAPPPYFRLLPARARRETSSERSASFSLSFLFGGFSDRTSRSATRTASTGDFTPRIFTASSTRGALIRIDVRLETIIALRFLIPLLLRIPRAPVRRGGGLPGESGGPGSGPLEAGCERCRRTIAFA